MDVAASVLDEMKGRNVVQNSEDYGAHSGERQEETYGSYKETAARPVRDAIVKNLA
jgi:hypothetical protein